MNFEKKIFYFCRVDGVIIANNVILQNDHTIKGINCINESRWEIRENNLVFLNLNGQVTTKFHIKINLEGKLIFLGSYCDKPTREVHHLLLEKNITETIGLHSALRKIEQKINLKSTDLDNNIFSLSRQVARLERTNRKIKVVFLVHNIATWDSLTSVYEMMCEESRIEVIIITIPRRFPGENSFAHEDENHNFFEFKKIPHIRFSKSNINNLQLLKYINPDAVFRQAPWDNDIPEEYSTKSLSFTNLFYVPYYGFNILKKFNIQNNYTNFYSNLDFHKVCAQIFCESDMTKKEMSTNNDRGGDNLIVTGHPKLEKLLEAQNNPQWPLSNSQRNKVFKIIWAPHHSFTGSQWLSFGLFTEVYKDMIRWVRLNEEIEMVLKPHPALFSTLIDNKLVLKEELDSFIKEWMLLPNATIIEGGDYGALMAASDMMITDGVSFLAEYSIFWQKPLVFLENKKHAPFNEMGELIKNASYVVHSVEEIQDLVRKICCNKKNDVRLKKREKLFHKLMPFKKGAAKNIVDSVKLYFNLIDVKN
ncbi:hypothetical protein [Commensalibacter melissae]|uniref:hypothetical protein n=1 Tax=Commensalibacter melissae TaxID=2070537 RepID=UPI0012D97431|nr:hypothetical protein [Commensalibacter melissae]MUG81681.1 hypothetical protein [Commensalibacter melissae]